MCEEPSKRSKFLSMNVLLLGGVALGCITGFLQIGFLRTIADGLSDVIISVLKLISLPMIFLSVVSTIAGMQNFSEIRSLGRRVLVYSLATTFMAAVVGLALFLTLKPVTVVHETLGTTTGVADGSYLDVLKGIIPSNVAQAFLENHVIGVMLMAVALGLAIVTLPRDPKELLHKTFSGLFSAVLQITRWLVFLMPVAVWAFVTIFIANLRHEDPAELKGFFLYIACVLGANLIQAVIVLPGLLKIKGLSPTRLIKAVYSALTLAFFTRSSNAALPVTLQSVQERAKVSPKVSNFSIPLCSTINMNGCAAFIIITVLYVSMSYGATYTFVDYALWLVIATLAAVGNAGVAMGCYFLSSALLASMNVPLTILGLILPMYTFIDMLESAVNVWSDCCVAAIVDKEMANAQEVETPPESATAS